MLKITIITPFKNNNSKTSLSSLSSKYSSISHSNHHLAHPHAQAGQVIIGCFSLITQLRQFVYIFTQVMIIPVPMFLREKKGDSLRP